MHKRILAIVTLLCAIPLLAFAVNMQQINTWVQSGGGSLSVNSGPAQTSLQGSAWNSYSSSTGTNTVAIAVDGNYFVNSLILDGVPQTASQIATLLTSGIPISQNDATPSVWVSFLRQQLTFTVNGGAGYIVFPSGAQPNVYAGATYRVFEFIPAKGQYISAITPSSYANITYTTNPSKLPAAVGQKVIVTVSSVTSDATLSAAAGGTAAAFVLPAGMTVAQAGRTCDACHMAQGLDTNPPLFALWSSSAHKASGVNCADCHQGTSTGAHPGTINVAL